MGDHIQITFTDLQPEQQEVLIAHLAEAGYEGFEENPRELKAFITEENFDKPLLNELAFKYQLIYTNQKIAAHNWNAIWESNFPIVLVDDFVGIRASFHEPIENVEHEIIITPKMSFGTGHHATTYMMIQQMREMDFTNKTVFDFGTGTGVLAILAEQLGAKKVVAVDNDEWSIANATENLEKNNCKKIKLELAGSIMTGRRHYDIILANINKNTILEHFAELADHLVLQGTLLLSGLLEEDEKEILSIANGSFLHLAKKLTRDKWISLRFNR